MPASNATLALVWLPPLLLLAVGALLALIADRVAALVRLDRGLYWTRAAIWSGLLLAPLVLHAWFLEWLDPAAWRQGWHAMPDLAGGGPLGPGLAYWTAMALPLPLWLLALILAHWPRGTSPQRARWLAGTVGLHNGRRWVLRLTLPSLTLIAIAAAPDLGTGAAGYPAALWSVLVLAALTLCGVAWSRERDPALQRQPAEPPPTRDLAPWPEAMRRQGIGLRTLHQYPADPPTPAPPTPRAAALLAQWPRLAARGLAPELADAVAALLEPPESEAPGAGNRLVLAPDDSGQEEATALAALALRERRRATTLVLVPDGAEALAARLSRWLDDEEGPRAEGRGPRKRCPPALGPWPSALLNPDSPPDLPAFLWVASAEHLSGRLIPALAKDRRLLDRIGLVVWWDLHRYSGMPAANLWAVAHRLHRLAARHGRRDLRHLAFVRAAYGTQAKFIRFLSQSLPQRFPPECQVALPPRLASALAVHLLEPGGEASPGDPLLEAARVSAASAWPTHLEPPPDLDRDALGAFLQQSAHGVALGARLQPDAASAGVLIREVAAADLRALGLILAAAGRADPGLPQRHAALAAAFGNPYVDYGLERLAQEPARLVQDGRTLVAAEPQPAIVQRHLLLALNELPETASGLLRTFRHESVQIRRVLGQLDSDGLIDRRDLRALRQGVLVAETEYHGRVTRDRQTPLDTVGTRLVPVIDPAAGEGEALLLQLDPERLTIRAYPNRVFVQGGHRYRVDWWPSVDTAIADGVRCRREQSPVLTWRVFAARAGSLQLAPGRQRVVFDRLPLARATVTLEYREDLFGFLEYARDPQSGLWSRSAGGRHRPIASRPMATRGLFLEIEAERLLELPSGLHSLAQALRHVFPALVGVDGDDLAILPVEAGDLGGRTAWGLLFVDLYPGGLGLAEAIEDDQALLLALLEEARGWLRDCPCQDRDGCPRCLYSPLALAATPDPLARSLSRGEALRILEAILD